VLGDGGDTQSDAAVTPSRRRHWRQQQLRADLCGRRPHRHPGSRCQQQPGEPRGRVEPGVSAVEGLQHHFVTASNAPGSLVAFTRRRRRVPPHAAPKRRRKPPPAPEEITTGSLGKSLATSSDGLIYQPISQYDAVQYSDGKLPEYADRTGLATILTMIARTAAATKRRPSTICFDPAKGADWHGVGWQNPLADKVTFAVGLAATERTPQAGCRSTARPTSAHCSAAAGCSRRRRGISWPTATSAPKTASWPRSRHRPARAARL